jgi:hypothetical protein
MNYLKPMAIVITALFLGFSIATAVVVGVNSKDAPPAPRETAVAEGVLLSVSDAGRRFVLLDQAPVAEERLQKLFGMNGSEATPDKAAPAAKLREFVCAKADADMRVKLTELKPGDSLQVRFMAGDSPQLAVEIQRVSDSKLLKVDAGQTALPPPVTETKLAREIRWAIYEDTRLSLASRLIKVTQENEVIVLEGVVPTALERSMVEEKANRVASGAKVLSRIKVSDEIAVRQE